ncbi:MAG TPA: BON domain-containing protein [Anaerolineales bacterium]|nr:BON domain-containing protein [Anaerolineales bacterium]
MFPLQTPAIREAEFFRCEELGEMPEAGNVPGPTRKADARIKDSIYEALWKDDILRAVEQDQLDVRVKNGAVYLNGHIVNTTNRNRIEAAIRDIPGIKGVQNNLVMDDRLTHEVAASLGALEHTYDCKFYTGVSHGLVSLNGIVGNEDVKLLAEKRAADHPNVRGVINHVQVSGGAIGSTNRPFLQPTIGEIIYFRDGISGIVKQVIIDPNNRRVVAMTVFGQFADPAQELESLNREEVRSPERLVLVPMDVVRYLTRVSGFLTIRSDERERYLDFNSMFFDVPAWDWVPPYPYCPDHVLFPAEQQVPHEPLAMVVLAEQLTQDQLLDNDSLGG